MHVITRMDAHTDYISIHVCVHSYTDHTHSQEVGQFSPQNTLDKIPAALKQDFSCLVIVGEHDSPEFKRQSKEYFEVSDYDDSMCLHC